MDFNKELVIKYFKIFTIYIFSTLYIIIGLKHFIDPSFFMSIMPPFIPFHKALVFVSGFFEVLFGILLLFQKTRIYAAYGLICLLILVFPANVYLYLDTLPREILGVTQMQALIRMPFQIPLILIAYWHSLKDCSIYFSYACIFLSIPTIVYFISL